MCTFRCLHSKTSFYVRISTGTLRNTILCARNEQQNMDYYDDYQQLFKAISDAGGFRKSSGVEGDS